MILLLVGALLAFFVGNRLESRKWESVGDSVRYPVACWLITILRLDCPEARTLPFPMHERHFGRHIMWIAAWMGNRLAMVTN